MLWHPKFSNNYRNRWFVGGLGWVLMAGAWVCLMSLGQLENGKLWLLWMFVLTTATDVGAFFVGRAYGVNALAPKLSPGKTREGALGGIALALAICVSALVLTDALSLYEAIGLTLTMSVISIFGDLFESLLKRVSGVKDSGDILPGHGGVLDRIDSIIAVLPFLVWSLA
jgi:phosphatidate cytidylyltransferase